MSQIETIFKFNGKEYTFDIRNADDAEKFEKGLDHLQEAAKNEPPVGKASESIRFQCQMIRGFFDVCLGADAGTEICGTADNLTSHYDAYKQFCDMVASQNAYIRQAKAAFGGNRQNRRNHKNGKSGKKGGQR